MLPERDDWQLLQERFSDTAEEEIELDLQLDDEYISYMYLTFLKGDGEDKKRILLMNFDVAAHEQMLRELEACCQYETAAVIQWYLDEYARLFPGRRKA